MSNGGYTFYYWAAVTVVILIAGFLVLVPNADQVRRREGDSQLNSVGNNLRIIEGAKEQWALENGKMPEDKVSLSDLTTYFKNNRIMDSVAGETYVVTTVGGLAQAITKGKLNGKRGPFTTTSF